MDASGGAVDKKKRSKYPKIITYLRDHHPAVYQLFDDLSMQGTLNPRGSAITFLVPDAKFLTKIEKLAEGDDAEKAADLLNMLILKDLYMNPGDFDKKKDDIATLSGKRLVIKSVDSKKVVLDTGAELVPDSRFKPFERQGKAKRGNLAVWLMKGEVDFDKAPQATFKYMSSTKPGTKEGKTAKGGYAYSRQGVRGEFIQSVQEEFMRRKAENGWNKDLPETENPFVSACSTILDRLYDTDKVTYRNIAAFVGSPNPAAAFYALVDSNLLDGKESMLEECRRTVVGGGKSSVSHFRRLGDNFMAEVAKQDKDALMASEEGMMKFWKLTNTKLGGSVNENKFAYTQHIKLFDEIINHNKWGGRKVFDDDTHAFLKNNGSLFKLVQLGSADLMQRWDDANRSPEDMADLFTHMNLSYNRSSNADNVVDYLSSTFGKGEKTIRNALMDKATVDADMRRLRLGTVSTVPMSSAVANKLRQSIKGGDEDSMEEEDSIVALKCSAAQSSTVGGDDEEDAQLSSSALYELQSFVRAKGGNFDKLKELLK